MSGESNIIVLSSYEWMVGVKVVWGLPEVSFVQWRRYSGLIFLWVRCVCESWWGLLELIFVRWRWYFCSLKVVFLFVEGGIFVRWRWYFCSLKVVFLFVENGIFVRWRWYFCSLKVVFLLVEGGIFVRWRWYFAAMFLWVHGMCENWIPASRSGTY